LKKALLLLLIVVTLVASDLTFAAAQSGKESAAVERDVRAVFDKWSTALTRGDKKTYLDTFWNSPRLVIRVANNEWRGAEAYRKRIGLASRAFPTGTLKWSRWARCSGCHL
jgi:hypothetical protein